MLRWKILLTLFLLSLCLLASAQTIIIDDLHDRFSAASGWTQSSSSSQRHAATYRQIASSLSETSTAIWTPDLPATASYDVSVWYPDGADRASDARYTVNYSGGSQTFLINQQSGGGQWNTLGTFLFNAGTAGNVTLSDQSSAAGKIVIADAVRFVRQGTSYPSAYQAMWAYSWGTGFLNATQTTQMINTARQNNVNAVFPEVRKAGDAYYVSATEPRASNIDAAYSDPLADILAKAHDTSGGKQYIEVHAWIIP
jgi:hypothetical protein